jgi:HEPN domain.
MSNSESRYRLRLARGFLEEARQDVSLGRWRSALDNSQLAVEPAAKAVLALIGSVGHTHNPAVHLREALAKCRFGLARAPAVQALTEKAELLGPDVYIPN